MSDSLFDDFMQRLDLPEAACDQVHPVVERFIEAIDPEDPAWVGDFTDWMEQANACLTSELLEMFGEPPEDVDEAQSYLWTVIRVSWLFYRKFHSGEPFNT